MPYQIDRSRKNRFQIPTTRVEYDEEETEFLRAIVKYKHDHHLIFLTAMDYLKILKSLGYQRPDPDGA